MATAIAVTATAMAVNHGVSLIMCAVADRNVKDSYTIDEAIAEIEKITGEGTVTFNGGDVEIKSSYKIKSRYKRILISKIIKNTIDEDGNKITNRTIYGLAAEWVGHNFISLFSDVNVQTDNVNLDKNFWDNQHLTIGGTIGLMFFGFL